MGRGQEWDLRDQKVREASRERKKKKCLQHWLSLNQEIAGTDGSLPLKDNVKTLGVGRTGPTP